MHPRWLSLTALVASTAVALPSARHAESNLDRARELLDDTSNEDRRTE
jgi:hypothetical protein